ncbi:MAG: hypothetical protein AB1512_02505 [Thermodesulfobacteriota bacterium]
MDRPTRYRDLLILARKFGVYEDPKRAKGSERLWVRELPDGTKRSIPVTFHGTGYVIGVGLIRAIRRRLLLTSEHGIPDQEFYGIGR